MHEQKSDQYLHKQKSLDCTKHDKKHEHVGKSYSTEHCQCSQCGASVEPGQHFCEECGNPIGANKCPHCHQTVDLNFALCPHCGYPLHTGVCSFCGETLDEDESFCSSCGNPRKGISCPTCGTLNFRSFCRHCNTPLNELAQKAMEKARKHPIIARTKTLAKELQELQQCIEKMLDEVCDDQDKAVLPDEQEQHVSNLDLLLLDKYKRLFANANMSIKKTSGSFCPQKTESQKRRSLIDKDQLKVAIEAYESKAMEMRNALEQLLPDPSDPPEEQRNFLCACLMETYATVVTKSRVMTEWVCNFCGCHHKTPSECTRPELGGTWLYEDKEIKQTITKVTTLYL